MDGVTLTAATGGATDIIVMLSVTSSMGFFLAKLEHLGEKLFFLGGMLTVASFSRSVTSLSFSSLDSSSSSALSASG
jgi:hypothetical protein